MKPVLILFYMISMLSGCASRIYGYSSEEWESLSPQQREAIEAQAKANIKNMKEKQHTDDITNKTLGDLFGSRSNQY